MGTPVPERSFSPHYSIWYFFFYFIHVYKAPRQVETNLWDNVLMQAERSYHFDHGLHVSKNRSALWFLCTFFMVLYMCIALGQGQPIRTNILMSTGKPHHCGHLLQVSNKSLQPLTLYTSFNDLINVYSRRSGTDNPRGQNCDVNRNLLSLRSFATGLKKNLFEVWFYIHFSWFYTVSGQGLTTPTGRNFDVSKNSHLLQG